MTNLGDSAPAMKGPLPLVIGVTGHRDLRPEDDETLKAQLRSAFTELQHRYPATPLILLSPLAEGADRLAASVALEMNIHLVVPLPMPREEYERDFTTAESRNEFHTLVAKADQSFVVSPPEVNLDQTNSEKDESRAEHYARVGAYIARNSQILIALWDGADSDKLGSTANVVQFKRKGLPSRFAPQQSRLDSVESGPVFIIHTPRLSNPQPAEKPDSHRKLFLEWSKGHAAVKKSHDRIYKRFDKFNRDTIRMGNQLAGARKTSKAYVFSAEQEAALSTSSQFMLSMYAWADSLALHFQRRTVRTLRGLLLLVFLAACFELYHFSQPQPWLLAHLNVAVLCVAYAWYGWARWGDYHNKYLDYRALAEGLRVRLFWRLAGLKDSVAEHYLRKQRGELDWIRQAIRAWDIPTSRGSQMEDASTTPISPGLMSLVFNRWVRDQARYFSGKMRRELKSSRLIEYAGYGFFLIGLVLAVVKAIPLADQPIFIAMSLTLVIAALLHIYAKTLGLSEHAKQYARMADLYARAEEHLRPLLDAGQYDEALKLLKELGQEALAENGDWVLLHRERPLEVPGK